jgi:hypothetical protein
VCCPRIFSEREDRVGDAGDALASDGKEGKDASAAESEIGSDPIPGARWQGGVEHQAHVSQFDRCDRILCLLTARKGKDAMAARLGSRVRDEEGKVAEAGRPPFATSEPVRLRALAVACDQMVVRTALFCTSPLEATEYGLELCAYGCVSGPSTMAG